MGVTGARRPGVGSAGLGAIHMEESYRERQVGPPSPQRPGHTCAQLSPRTRGWGFTFRPGLGFTEPPVQHQLEGEGHVVDLPRTRELMPGGSCPQARLLPSTLPLKGQHRGKCGQSGSSERPPEPRAPGAGHGGQTSAGPSSPRRGSGAAGRCRGGDTQPALQGLGAPVCLPQALAHPHDWKRQ